MDRAEKGYIRVCWDVERASIDDNVFNVLGGVHDGTMQ